MIEIFELALPRPAPLFNPLTSAAPLSPIAILAGPYGLLAFLPLIPVVLLIARRWPRAALILGGLAWLFPTLQWQTTLALLAWVAVAVAWICLLAAFRRRGSLSERVMIALVWLGLHALVFPLWWQTTHQWYRTVSPMAALHNVGFSYFLFRFIAWGVDVAREPRLPTRLTDTVCWILYPPCMRLGPVLTREMFFERLDAWGPPELVAGLKRFGLFILGGIGLAIVGKQLPHLVPGGPNFFARPEAFETDRLLRVFYLVPIQIYLLLWTYNELAAALSRWVGIRVDDNFNWLPRATSVRDFWHRWHVTVGAWLRKYIYIPLGGNRQHASLNILLVFAYCGVWHGASWSFLAWGLSQGLALIGQRGWDTVRPRLGVWAPRGPAWIALCWLLTLHYQLATIVMFADFDHLGLRLFAELARRLLGTAANVQ